METQIKELREKLVSKKTIAGIVDTRTEINYVKHIIKGHLDSITELENLAVSMHESMCEHTWEWVFGYDEKYKFIKKCHMDVI